MICPICRQEVGEEHFACKSGEKGGRGGVGKVKARTREQARAAAMARWRKVKVWGIEKGEGA